MKKSFTFSTLVTTICFIAYFVIAYVIQGNHWIDLVFLAMAALSSIFHQKLDDFWEEWRNRDKISLNK